MLDGHAEVCPTAAIAPEQVGLWIPIVHRGRCTGGTYTGHWVDVW